MVKLNTLHTHNTNFHICLLLSSCPIINESCKVLNSAVIQPSCTGTLLLLGNISCYPTCTSLQQACSIYLSATSLQHLPLCYNKPAAFTSLLQQACSIYLSVTTSRQHLPLCYNKQALFTPLLHQTCSNYPTVTTNRQHLPLCYNKPAAITPLLQQTGNIYPFATTNLQHLLVPVCYKPSIFSILIFPVIFLTISNISNYVSTFIIPTFTRYVT